MAFRRRTRRFGRRRTVAGAFAPALRGGRSIAWESLAQAAGSLPGIFPTLPQAAGTFTTRHRVLLPENVTRGVVTLERVRDSIQIWANETNPVVFEQFCTIGLQLVPTVGGAIISTAQLLVPTNAADLESNRWIWRRSYMPHTRFIEVATAQVPWCRGQDPEIDIKSRRRFNRAMWALYLTVIADTTFETSIRMNIDLRALFRTGDGL